MMARSHWMRALQAEAAAEAAAAWDAEEGRIDNPDSAEEDEECRSNYGAQ
jgi:hypothetical protein